jgi:chorismate mutase/prephenate dehydratase
MDFGIVPIENSNQGSIKTTIDRLIKEEIKICGEDKSNDQTLSFISF